MVDLFLFFSNQSFFVAVVACIHYAHLNPRVLFIITSEKNYAVRKIDRIGDIF